MCDYSESPYVRAKRKAEAEQAIKEFIVAILYPVLAPVFWLSAYVLVPLTVIISVLYPFIVAYLCITHK